MDEFASERLHRGLAEFASRNYEQALEELFDMSLADNDIALAYVAEAMKRLKVNRDCKKIERLRIMAANLGNTLACLRLAEDYYDGGMQMKKAERYFQKAAEKGSNLAYRRLGEVHLNTGSDFERARRFKQAANHGSANAMFEYARLIEFNKVDPRYAHHPHPVKNWFKKGNARKEEAKDWYLKAAFAGNIDVIEKIMGVPRVRGGKPIMQDIVMMKDSIDKGAAQEDLFCLSVKGYFLLKSDRMPFVTPKYSDYIEAFELLRKAANKGNFHAMDTIAEMYYEGRHVPKNLERALAWSLNAINSAPDFSPEIEGGGLLLCDLEDKIQLDVCTSIKQNPKKFCL